jgi:DNA polymerase I-like protein with 3'-5' exonuclease and polymerase domains
VNTWSIDTEFGFRGGDEYEAAFVPVIFCAHEVHTGEQHSFWGRDEQLAQFIREHLDDLFVSHNLIAEAKYLLRLGIALPPHWFDTMLAWRFVTNKQEVPPFGLSEVLVALGISHPYGAEKERLQEWIGGLGFSPYSPDDQRTIRNYCMADCTTTAAAYLRLIRHVPAVWMRYVTEFCVELARMELRGIALDMGRYTMLLERKAEVVEAVTTEANAVFPVFFANGQIHKRRFFSWCASQGIGWPLRWDRKTGRKTLSLDQKIRERMKYRHPFIEVVHEAMKTTTQLNDRTLTVDFDRGLHYFGNVPFAAATGRTSFKNFLFSGPKWMRWLVVPRSPDHVLVSVDFEAEEVLIAAHLSHDAGMTAGYVSDDPHMAFAITAGAAPPNATKATHGAIRKKYKAVNLGVNYGQTAHGLAESTGMYFSEARSLLAQHRRAYADFWGWADRYTLEGFHKGVCYTTGGWPRRVGRKDNHRSVANFAVQGTGADLMRLAVLYLSRQGLQLLAAIHDGFLLECRRDQLSQVRRAVDYALCQAVHQVLPGAPMRWKVDVFEERYEDEDKVAAERWHLVNQILASPTRGRMTVLVG